MEIRAEKRFIICAKTFQFKKKRYESSVYGASVADYISIMLILSVCFSL